MKVIERINEILKEKNMSKKELAHRLIDFGLKAHKTGEIPSISSIYAYLNGNIDLKADMIPYIADALGICEQELFSSSKESLKLVAKFYNRNSDYRHYEKIIELLEYLPPKTLNILEDILIQNKKTIQNLNENINSIQKDS
ncbi:helix-turn-helix domain-containing protein [Helicobacter sp. MIT 05-5294]|uniref:helix-turn-helix domain-containing protein n=1 Tax=Helicobacter sp. MIT 05-5294 TaxID=1548150 RepID=UPI00051FD6E2|nr:helix-turn-helix domain-containing protein [Helicobacter sp. MIT 05-5294]TLD85653.1 XRE family transcriptional regulator [Helicobacter sp. MIT 05-5294]